MASDLPSAVREHVLQMLDEVNKISSSSSIHKALTVDDATLRIISRGLTVSELMDDKHHFTVVDSIHASRERRAPEELRASMDVVYFLTPTRRSVDALIADYDESKPFYQGSAYIFFSRRLPESLLGLLKQSTIVRFARCLREANLDFVALHPHAFSLDAPSALHCLYGPCGAALRTAFIEQYAEQLCTVCNVLGERLPHVRCHNAAHPVVKQFATRLAAMLAATAAQAPKAPMLRARATILIVDRASDALTPLLHDFSLEGLAQGIGVLHEGKFRRGATQSQSGEVLLRDDVAVWADLRYRSYELVPTLLQAHMERFVSENATVVKAQRGEALSAAEKEEAMRRQFAFSFVKQREQLKMQEELVSAVTTQLIHEGKKTPWYEQLLLEQDLATGSNIEGAALRRKEAMTRAVQLMQQRSASTPAHQAAVVPSASDRLDRLRLSTILSICFKMGDDELERDVLRPAGVALQDLLEIRRGLFYLGVPLLRKSRAASAETLEQVELARHEPELKQVISAALRGDLPAEFVEAGGNSSADDEICSSPLPLVGSWAFASGGTPSGPSPARLIVFVLGGGCQAELRCAHQLARDGSVIFGSTSLLTPQQYLMSLRGNPDSWRD